MSSIDSYKFKNLIIFYFSGTGNAKQVSNWIINNAESIGIVTQLVNIGQQELINDDDITKETLIGFCYPTHGFNAPPIVLKYLWNFRRSKTGNNFFVLNTRAGMKISRFFTPGLSGIALIIPALMLIMKGYKLLGYRSIDLPSNWISIHPGLKEKVVFSIFRRCRRITNEFSDKVLSGKKIFKGFWELPIDLAISPISIGYYLYCRFILSKTFIATNSCIQCGTCVKNCPVDAIKMTSYLPYWSYKCESCMKCMNNCPKRAIETPHGFVTLVWWIAFSILPMLILKYTSDFIKTTPLTRNIVYYVLYTIFSITFIFGSYWIMHLLLKFKPLNKIIKYTSLTTYSFWRRYKAPKNVK